MHKDIELKWLRQLFYIRLFEEKIANIYSSEKIRCPVHLAIGHEASAVGVCANLDENDLVLSYHRSHHHYLAKGGDPQKLLWELLGDVRGCSGGRGGSTHLTAPEVGFVASTAIISGTLPVATGLAHSLKIKKSSSICVVFCGDAAIEEGVFFESLNIATLWSLPLLVVIEDNDLSCYTEKKIRQSFVDYAKIAALYNINYFLADGSDLLDVHQKSNSAISQIKKESKPCILDLKVYRALEHCGPEIDDLLAYRSDMRNWPAKDPILKLKNSCSISNTDFEKIQTDLSREIETLFSAELK